MRARELGIRIGELASGPEDAITDVDGGVGHSTIVRGEGPLVVGEGPVRTGVTVVCPREGLARDEPVFAGTYTLNGNGEMTGLSGSGRREPLRPSRLPTPTASASCATPLVGPRWPAPAK